MDGNIDKIARDCVEAADTLANKQAELARILARYSGDMKKLLGSDDRKTYAECAIEVQVAEVRFKDTLTAAKSSGTTKELSAAMEKYGPKSGERVRELAKRTGISFEDEIVVEAAPKIEAPPELKKRGLLGRILDRKSVV